MRCSRIARYTASFPAIQCGTGTIFWRRFGGSQAVDGLLEGFVRGCAVGCERGKVRKAYKGPFLLD